MIDAIIIASYFGIILLIGLRAWRKVKGVSVNEYFLSSHRLRWPTIAMSTIGPNVHAGHFLGMMGSAYLYGLAQANFEINAIFGILVAAFKNGFVVLMSAAVLLVKPSSKLVWYALFLSVALSLGLKWLVPDLAYFNRALLTIVLTFGVVAVPTVIQNGWRITVRDLVQTASPNVGYGALGLGVSLIVMHVFFH